MRHELWYSVVVRDRHGKVISREHRRSRSFLKQWNQLVYVQMVATLLQPHTITDTSGAPKGIYGNESNFRMNASAGTTTYGIRVGTGNTPVAIDDYKLDTPIGQGTGENQMSHLVCTVATSVVAAPSCSFIISRSIVNNSAAEIIVREAGIYFPLSVAYFGCGTRDVFGTPQAVPIGGTITINWTIKVTV